MLKSLKLKISPLFLGLGVVLVFFNLGYVFLCYLIAISLHELGHALVAKKLGYKLNALKLMPYGTELSIEQTIYNTKDEIIISLAGPFVNLCLIILNLAIWWLYPVSYFYTEMFVYANVICLLFNLLPIFPLDGGRVFLSILSKKMKRKNAYKIIKTLGLTVAILFLIMFIISSFYKINFTLFIISFFLMAGSFENAKNIKYKTVVSMGKPKNLVKKARLIKNIAISSNATLITAVKAVDPSCFNRFYVLDNNFKTKAIVNEIMLKDLITTNSASKTFEQII